MEICNIFSRWIWGRLERREVLPSYSPLRDASPPPPYIHGRHPLPSDTCNKPLARAFGKPHRQGPSAYFGLAKGKLESSADENILMLLSQQVTAPIEGWQARLQIQADDIPSLMRNGLHWTEANLDREAGYIGKNPQDEVNSLIPSYVTCMRVYFLRDLAEQPQWTAKMTVFFTDLDQLSQFRFCDLRLDQIIFCAARTTEDRMVYLFNRIPNYGCGNINTIYDDMPLDGWWPWPKRSKAN